MDSALTTVGLPLALGVIIQPTGDHQNILKTKPPLCIDIAGADAVTHLVELGTRLAIRK